MSKLDDELTRRLHRAERPVDGDALFEGLARRRSHRERVRRVQGGLLAFAVLASTGGGFVFLRSAFDADEHGVGEQTPLGRNGEIVFAREGSNGLSQLYGAHPDGSGVHQITDGATSDRDPAVSPDGQTIAFVRQFDDFNQRIAIMAIAGGPVIHLSEDYLRAEDPAWSPDGMRLAYVTTGIDSQQVYTVSRDGRDINAPIDFFGQLAGPAWSIDGTTIALAVRSAGGSAGRTASWDLGSLDVETTAGIEPLVFSERNEEAPAWSPDGSRIAFTREDEILTVEPDGGSETLVAAVDARLEPELVWAPDGSALLASDGTWIYRVDATLNVEPSENFVRLIQGHSPAWQPVSAGSEPELSPTSEPTVSPSVEPAGRDIGLGFNVCNLAVLGGIDFLGDGTDGTAWTASKVEPNGKCPSTYDGTNGVAVDFTGDGDADSWSETIEHCTMCGPFMARDLNEDGTEEVIITLQGGTIIQYGIYTVMPVDGRLHVVPFRTGEPGHNDAGHAVGQPFTFWVGGDEGSSYWFQCEVLPEFRLTDTYTPVDGGPDAETTVHETHVSLRTDGIADILDAQTYTVLGVVDLQYATSKPDCGLGVDVWRLQAA